VILRLMEVTRDDVRALAATAIAVIPIGSAEQHGPHLPLGTDTLLAEAVLESALSQPEVEQLSIVVTPTVPIGCSGHHLFAAAVSLRPETLLSVLHDISESLIVSGFRRLFILNGHGGNDECVQLAARELVLRHHSVAAAACSYWALGQPDEQLRPELTPGHAGWFETSLMLATYGHLVRRDRVPSRTVSPGPVFARRDVPGLRVQVADEWARVDGFTDPASDASEETGGRLLRDRAGQVAASLRVFAAQTAALGVGTTGGKTESCDGTGAPGTDGD
jgi:creatinine amidohydrolase